MESRKGTGQEKEPIRSRVAVISSAQDEAGRNIRTHLQGILASEYTGERALSLPADFRFREVPGRLIYEDGIDRDLDADQVLFISRHRSIHPTPVLTVHVTGNLAAAEFGGRPRSLAPAAPEWMRAILTGLRELAPEGYRASYEVTHHGPTELTLPSLFVEIGSTETEWRDPRAGEAVARAILGARPVPGLRLIGFGGTHYAARQTEIATTTGGSFGHIAHSREVPALDTGMVKLMRDRTRAQAAYMDRKALAAADQRRLEGILSDLGVTVLSEGEIRSLGSVEWASYLAIRRLAGEIVPGSRCHVHGLTGRGEPVRVDLNPDLVLEAVKSDEKTFFRSLERMPVVHLSYGGMRVLPAFITFAADAPALINELITLCVKLITVSEHTVVEGDRLIIRRVRFDPERARAYGIPRGPLFGQLSAGRAVEVQGRVITPAMVETCSVKEIHIPGLERYA
ncbi:MAG: D-tyrosyl-tRNA(Tyr) deacylase [Methanomicrobiales archaeon]|nr:D-tyrosyl-tRNA(Tyr) deacylase [Methanomicrobiales archaeon]